MPRSRMTRQGVPIARTLPGAAHGLRDSSGKPGEALCGALSRTCSE
ncbi:hypothetical protein [Agriterribacter sp.]|nr:hypothetical protein [Agriterribacter sp.]HTN06927.1 hypothetical protein [Agriterribacter sp.]